MRGSLWNNQLCTMERLSFLFSSRLNRMIRLQIFTNHPTSKDLRNYLDIWTPSKRNTIYIYISESGQITTSAEVTLKWWFSKGIFQNPLNSGLGIILVCPDIHIYIYTSKTRFEYLEVFVWMLSGKDRLDPSVGSGFGSRIIGQIFPPFFKRLPGWESKLTWLLEKNQAFLEDLLPWFQEMLVMLVNTVE